WTFCFELGISCVDTEVCDAATASMMFSFSIH
ncbi:MAG: hypothetical protein ACJA0Q_001742, partial [Saprospiraceae bacterium]